MDERERRMAQNEALFREVNERVNDVAGAVRDDTTSTFEYLCECSNTDCTFRIELTRAEYEEIRSEPTQFAVRPDHYIPEVERVVSENPRYAIVRKIGEAGEYVEQLDPRSR
jgi:hypothetical protein